LNNVIERNLVPFYYKESAVGPAQIQIDTPTVVFLARPSEYRVKFISWAC